MTHNAESDAGVSPISDGCTCPHKIGALGFLYGTNMGRGTLRTGTTPGCPVHDTCQGYTKAERARRPSWSYPWCPVHGAKTCPTTPVRGNQSDPSSTV